MSEEDPKAPSGAVPPIKRRVIKSAQTAPEGGAVSEPSLPAPAGSIASPSPAPVPKAPVPTAEPLPAVRIESRPDGRRLMDARAPRRPQEDSRRRRPDRPQQSPEARAADLGMPRRPERTRQTFDDRPRSPRADAAPRGDRDAKTTAPDGFRRAAQAKAREEGEAKRAEPRSTTADATTPVDRRRPEPKPTVESAPPPAPKEPDSNAEIALAGAPPVRFKQAVAKKDKPKTGKEALAQKARDSKHARKKGRGATSGATRGDAAAAKAKAIEEDAEASETDEQEQADADVDIPKRPSLWQRVVGLFRRGK